MPRNHPEAISPTAHYTGNVWLQNGLSHPAFSTLQGQAYYYAMRGPLALSNRLGGPTLDSFLLARHRLIDLQLEAAIERGEITQIIEVAAGLSPRGWRFVERYRERITYLETDLPGMALRKRRLLDNGGLDSPNHHVAGMNALVDDGPDSLATLASALDPTQGTAIITEGLINYFDTETVVAMWQRFARVLSRFPRGLYLSDLHLGSSNQGMATDLFMKMLSTFVRGQVHLHFNSDGEACDALREAGFDQAVLFDPRAFADRIPDCGERGAGLVRVVSAGIRLNAAT